MDSTATSQWRNWFNSLLPRSEFARFTLLLVSGTAGAQAIALVVSPLLTRLYTPGDFGVLALFISVTTLLISVCTAKYDMAIVVPTDDEAGFNLFALSSIISLATSLLLVPVIFFLNAPLARWLGDEQLRWWLFAVPGFVFISGVHTAARYWFNRRKSFKLMATNGVWRASVSAGLNLAMGWARLGAAGLINGLFLGQLFSTWLFISQIWRDDRRFFKRVTRASLLQQARLHANFPKFLIPSGFVEVAAGQIPSLLLGSVYGMGVLGLFSLATRVVNLPLSLIGSAVGDVFRQAASHEYAANGNCRALFRRTFRKLVLFAIVPCLLMLILSPWVFGFVFGEKWQAAGVYVQILSAMFFIRFVSSPLSTMFYIAQKQRCDLIIQIISFSALASLLGLALHLRFGPLIAVGLYSAVYCLKYLAELICSYRFTINHNWHPPLTKGSVASLPPVGS